MSTPSPVCEFTIDGKPDGKVSLVTHDWGAYIGYPQEKTHPDMFIRMAALDVGGHLKPMGLKAPLMFHSPKWLQIVADSGGRAEGIAGAGHWLMETHPEIVNETLSDWFREQ